MPGTVAGIMGLESTDKSPALQETMGKAVTAIATARGAGHWAGVLPRAVGAQRYC